MNQREIHSVFIVLVVMVDIAAMAFVPKATTEPCIPIPSQRRQCHLIPSQVKSTFHLTKNTVKTSNTADDTTPFNCTKQQQQKQQVQQQEKVSNLKTLNTQRPKKIRYPRMGNFPDVEWQAVPMDHLRHHPKFDELPPSLHSLSCLEDVRSFRQDSWQWDALHSGRCTTSQAAAALGFLEPKAGNALQIPPSWRRGGVGAFYRMKEPALRTLEEMRQVLCSQSDNITINHHHHHQPPLTTTTRQNKNIWKNPKNSKFPFAAKYVHQMTNEERERRRNQAQQHPVRTMAVKMMWGNTQEATAVLTALNYFWKEHDKDIRIKEVGMCGAGLSDNTTSSLLIGASPDALLCHPNGTMEVLEVKNHCPFVSTRGRSGKIFAIRELPFQQPFLPPLYVSQMMMEMKCVGPECRSAVMVRQTATSGALILRLQRDDVWIEEMMHWLNTFQVEFVDKEIPPPPDFFWQDEGYRQFVNRTKDLGSSVEVLKHVPHKAIQRMSGQIPNSTSLFLD